MTQATPDKKKSVLAIIYPFTVWVLHVLVAAGKLVMHWHPLLQSAKQTQKQKMDPAPRNSQSN